MNELSAVFERLGIDTGDVLAAAATKWNFLKFSPGLVGGHCIGVDPYYLTYRAEKAGYHPQVILAGRRINDGVGQRIARECVRRLLKGKKAGAGHRPGPDLQGERAGHAQFESRAISSRNCGPSISMFRFTIPWPIPREVKREYGVELTEMESLRPADAVILAVAHEPYVRGGWPLVVRLLKDGSGVVLDVKSQLDRCQRPKSVDLWRL